MWGLKRSSSGILAKATACGKQGTLLMRLIVKLLGLQNTLKACPRQELWWSELAILFSFARAIVPLSVSSMSGWDFSLLKSFGPSRSTRAIQAQFGGKL